MIVGALEFVMVRALEFLMAVATKPKPQFLSALGWPYAVGKSYLLLKGVVGIYPVRVGDMPMRYTIAALTGSFKPQGLTETTVQLPLKTCSIFQLEGFGKMEYFVQGSCSHKG